MSSIRADIISLMAVLLLLFLCPGVSPAQETEREPNDDMEEAQIIQIDKPIQGYFQKEEDEDWYRLDFSLEGKHIARVTLSGVPGIDSSLYFLDSRGNTILRSTFGEEGEGEILTNIGLTTSTYFIRVRGKGEGGSPTPYTLEVKLLGPWDESKEFEPNDDSEMANPIPLGKPVEGYAQPPLADWDWYRFSIPEPGMDILVIRTSGIDKIGQQLTLLDDQKKKLKDINAEEEGEGETIVRMRVAPGTYYLRVVLDGINAESPYELVVGEEVRPATPEEVKKALQRALDYLADEQTEEGYWGGGYEGNAGIAGLCLMAFVGGECAGKDYSANIERTIRYLKSQYHPPSDYKEGSREKDFYGGLIGEDNLMYSHGIATLALIEAMVDLNDVSLEPIVEEAVRLIIRTQNTEHKPESLEGPVNRSSSYYGGWRYDPDSTDSDISVSSWLILALKAAQMAGFEVPEWSKAAAVAFLHSCYDEENKVFTYKPGDAEGCVRAAVGALCLQLLAHPEDPRIKTAVRYMLNNPPMWVYEYPGDGYPFYYWYYGTRAMLSLGGEDWKLWKSWMCRLLVENQSDSGAWESKEREEGMSYYTTALGALMLELCCGHVPVYMRKQMPQPGLLRVIQEGKEEAGVFKNVEIVLDVSNSMWGQIQGESKIAIAKNTLQQIITSLHEDSSVGFRVYGHRYSLEDGRACKDTEQLVPIGPMEKKTLIDTIHKLQPRGKTPLVYSVLEAIKDFKNLEEGSIILITDGLESCGGDIRSIGPSLRQSGIELNLHIVGFDIKETEAREELEKMAREGGGIYLNARDSEELIASLEQTLQMPYEVIDSRGKVIGRGLVGGEALRVREGSYRIRLKIGTQTLEEPVQVMGGETLSLYLKKKDGRWVLEMLPTSFFRVRKARCCHFCTPPSFDTSS